jgi:hypothetical protein
MNATQKFIQFVMEKGFTQAEAETILVVYKKARVIKLDKFMPAFEVKHGAFLDTDVLRNALSA